MNRKYWLLLACAVLLGGFSLYLNRDWFAKDTIQIFHRSRPARTLFFNRKRALAAVTDPVIFGFTHKLRLKELKVIPLSEIATNKYPHPIWHLLSDSNSLPIKNFFYGQPLPGMRPAIKGAVPDPLAPGIPYRLFIEADLLKGEHDFTAQPRTP